MTVSVLILGGTAESRELAEHLVRVCPTWRIVTSLAGRTSHPRDLAGEVRTGGFGGVEGFVDYLVEERISAIIDATHPYAAQISKQAVEAVERVRLPFVRLQRAPWKPQEGDDWTLVTDIDAATHEIARTGRTCLITTGANDLADYKNVHGAKLIARLIEPLKGEPPVPGLEIVIGKPPYTLNDEVTLFKLLGIDVLVSKNAGGTATQAKIDAARQLGITVIMIDRPPVPSAETVTTVDDAVRWLSTSLEHPLT